MHVTAIVLAAGKGRRMGRDKALLELGGRTSVQRVVDACAEGGTDSITVVRRASDARLPSAVHERAIIVRAARTDEMIESLRLALRRAMPVPSSVLVFPVDYALVDRAVVAAVLRPLRDAAAEIVLPLFQERPGHPIGIASTLLPEIRAAETLRDVVVRDRSRVEAVPVESRWVLQDLDTPGDLAAAQAWLEEAGVDDEAGKAREPKE